MENLTKDEAIVLAGSAAKLSALLGVSRSAITQWGYAVPAKRVEQLKTLKPEWFLGGFTHNVNPS
jgi:DNA-binding transcriptional regulator YdaS (Cro superfamily)